MAEIKPTRKDIAAGFGGGAAIVIVGILKKCGVEFGAEWTAGLASIITIAVMYFVPSK